MQRRSFLKGVGALIAAPAIIRWAPIMPVKALPAIDRYPMRLADVISPGVFRYYFDDAIPIHNGDQMIINPSIMCLEVIRA